MHRAGEARFALATAGRDGVLLLSSPGAAGVLGPLWWRALLDAADAPGGALDCADAPGHALAALRAGLRDLVLAGDHPAFPAVAAAAAACGARLRPQRPPALDLGRLNLQQPGARNKLAAWLAVAR